MSLPRTKVELGGDVNETSFSTTTALNRILREKKTSRHEYRGIPEPEETIESLQQTVAALKEVVEILIGVRGQSDLQMLKIEDVAKLGDEIVTYLINELGP